MMNTPSLNNNPFGNTEVDYPARVVMKAITHSKYSEDDQRTAIRAVLVSLGLGATNWKKKNSKAGKYVSHSFTVAITSGTQLKKLYTMLNDLDVVKMLL